MHPRCRLCLTLRQEIIVNEDTMELKIASQSASLEIAESKIANLPVFMLNERIQIKTMSVLLATTTSYSLVF